MKLWKVLSAAALVAGLAPYKVEKDEETGKTTYQALLWQAISSEQDGGKHFGIDLGAGTLTQKLREKAAAKEEAHLFSDELTVDFHREEQAADTEAAEAEIEAMAAEAEAQAAQAEAEAAEAEASEEAAAETEEPPVEG